jgi:hypothetical protein
MKEVIEMVRNMVTLNETYFGAFLKSPNMKVFSNLIVLLVGVGYGMISIMSNAAYIANFDSPVLQNVLVPLIFIIFGLLSALITKIGLSLLLWAGAKGFGGKAKYKEISAVTPVALLPGLLGVPFLSGWGEGDAWVLVLLAAGVVWMYMISAKILKTTQSFPNKKAYAVAFLVFLFLFSVYYIVVPPGT